MFKNMSRWSLGLLAALLLMLTLAACGDSTSTSSSVTTAAATTATATTVAATTVSATTSAVTTAVATTASATTATATTANSTSAVATTLSPTTLAATSAVATTAAPTTAPGAASTTSAAPATSTSGLTITDDAKRSVKFDKIPKRIVSLAPSNTELLYALGLGDMVVGVDDYSDYPAEAAKKAKIGGYNTTNLEKVVSLSPDLVLAAGITDPKLVQSIADRKINVVVLNPSNLLGVLADVKLLAQINDVADAGAAVSDDFQKRLDTVTAKIKGAGTTPPRVFYELDPTLYTVGPGSFIDDMIQKAGGQNIVTDASNPYPQLNQEAVIAKDPQVILIGDDSGGTDSPDKILTRPGWSGISAVKNKRIAAISANLVNRPGPRAVQGVEAIAKALYPDLFK